MQYAINKPRRFAVDKIELAYAQKDRLVYLGAKLNVLGFSVA